MSFTIPKEIKWTKEDFIDLYYTMVRFKKRFMKRRKVTHILASDEKSLEQLAKQYTNTPIDKNLTDYTKTYLRKEN